MLTVQWVEASDASATHEPQSEGGGGAAEASPRSRDELAGEALLLLLLEAATAEPKAEEGWGPENAIAWAAAWLPAGGVHQRPSLSPAITSRVRRLESTRSLNGTQHR